MRAVPKKVVFSSLVIGIGIGAPTKTALPVKNAAGGRRKAGG